MRSSLALRSSRASLATLTLIGFIAVSSAQQGGGRGEGPDTLPDTPQVLGTAGQRFRVVPIKGFFRPSALAFLPNGDILVAERSGGLRIIRNGVLDPQPIGNMPAVVGGPARRFGLWDVALHPRFAENRLVYFTYLKPNPNENISTQAAGADSPSGTSVLARGRFDGGHALTDVKDLFVSNAQTNGFSVARLVFAPDGKIFMSIGMPLRDRAHGGPIASARRSSPRIQPATPARSCGSTTMGALRRTIRSPADRDISRRSMRSVFAIRWA